MDAQYPTNGQTVDQRRTNDQANGQPTVNQQTSKATDQRVTVADAALLLGLSEDAVRSRLRRGTLRRETGRDGTVFVVLGSDRPTANQRPTNGRPDDQQNDRLTTDKPAESYDNHGEASEAERVELVEVLRDEVEHLRGQLEAERTASSELRRIVAGLVQRVPELEVAPGVPTAPRDAHETASEGESSTETPTDGTGEPRQRSWLARFFGIE